MNIDVFDIHRNNDASEEFQFFWGHCSSASPPSCDCERTFSALGRMRTKFRRKLPIHVPFLLRLKNSLPVNYLDDEFTSLYGMILNHVEIKH